LRFIQPDLVLNNVTELKPDMLQPEVDTILLDLDHTLTHWKSTIVTKEIKCWVNDMKEKGYKLMIVSNAATYRRSNPVSEELSIPCIINALKPLPFGFKRAMNVYSSSPKNTAMVGDQMFTDILGAKRLGIFTVLTTPFSKKEALITKIVQRPLERLFGRNSF